MSFTSTVEEVSSTRRKFKIAVPSQLVREAFEAAVKDVQQTANVRGFRKGKVPNTLVRKFFENDVRKKAFERVVERSYADAIAKTDLQIVSYPQIENDGEFTENSEFKFSATVDVNPKVEVKGYKDLKLKFDEKGIDDEGVQKELGNLVRMAAKYEPDTAVRPITKTDFVRISYEGTIDGAVQKNLTAKDQRFDLSKAGLLPEFEAAIVGAKPGESKNFNVKYPADYGDKTLAGKTATFSLKIEGLDKANLPELNDELATRFGAQTLASLKTSMKEMLNANFENRKVEVLQEQIVEQLLKTNSFEVPESLIENTVDRAIDMENQSKPAGQKLNKEADDVRKGFRDWARDQVKDVLVLGHVARAEGLTVDDKEVAPELARFAQQMGTDAQSLLKRGGQQIVEEVRGRVLLSKTVKHLIKINGL